MNQFCTHLQVLIVNNRGLQSNLQNIEKQKIWNQRKTKCPVDCNTYCPAFQHFPLLPIYTLLNFLFLADILYLEVNNKSNYSGRSSVLQFIGMYKTNGYIQLVCMPKQRGSLNTYVCRNRERVEILDIFV